MSATVLVCVSIIAKISKGYPGVRITFGYLNCPVCAKQLSHPSDALITSTLSPHIARFTRVCDKVRLRLKVEKMENDAKLTDPSSPFHLRPLAYALQCFAYYVCSRCSCEYFGGRRDCEQNAQAENRPAEEFVCFQCADLKSVKCKKPEHAEYQLWKCRSAHGHTVCIMLCECECEYCAYDRCSIAMMHRSSRVVVCACAHCLLV